MDDSVSNVSSEKAVPDKGVARDKVGRAAHPYESKSPLARAKDAWGLAAGAGAWIVAAAGGLVLRPPLWIDADAQQSFALATFAATAVAGLLAVPMSVWSGPRVHRRWLTVAIVALSLTFVSLGIYEWIRTGWSVNYVGERWVKGGAYTPKATSYRREIASREGQPPTDERLLADAAGSIDELWTADDLRTRRLILGMLYVSTVIFSAATILAIAQCTVALVQKRR